MSNKKLKVLLLSAPIGSGHRLAAEALRDAFEKNIDVSVVHGNVFDFFPAILGKAFLKTYLLILDACPWLYKAMYQWGNKGEGSLWLRNIINGVLAFLGEGFIKKVNPDVVIATHATPAGIMSIYKRRRNSNLYLCGVITDYTVHRWWLCDQVDTYFIANEGLKEKFPSNQEVIATGIPLRDAFNSLDKEACRKEFEWSNNDIVCLLMGGGDGLLPMEQIIPSLLNKRLPNLHLVGLTGKNKELTKNLLNKFSNNIEVYSYTDKIPYLMGGADIIISKAGGVSSAEALASNLNFIIYKPLPGQEENNAKFLASKFGATIAYNQKDVLNKVEKLCRDKDLFSSNSKRYFGKPQASEDICNFIVNKLNNVKALDR